jgi:hypothetical protein
MSPQAEEMERFSAQVIRPAPVTAGARLSQVEPE